MRTRTIFIFCCFLTTSVLAQVEFYRENCTCQVSGDSYSSVFPSDSSNLFISLPTNPNFSIKKAFLIGNFTWRDTYVPNSIDHFDFKFDGNPMRFNNEELVVSKKLFNEKAGLQKIWCDRYVKDVSSFIKPNQFNYSLLTPENNNSSIADGNLTQFSLVILFESNDFELVESTFLLNDKPVNDSVIWDFEPYVVSRDSNRNVSTVINASWFCQVYDTSNAGENNDGSRVYINNEFKGVLGNNEYNGGSCSGVHGTFSFVNNELFGFKNDNPNEDFQSTDAIGYVQNSLNQNNEFYLKLVHDNFGNIFLNKTNPVNSFYLNYTSTCDGFSPIISKPNSICLGDTSSIEVEGGYFYNWEPLSNSIDYCSDCSSQTVHGNKPNKYMLTVWKDTVNSPCYYKEFITVNVNNGPKPTSVNIEKANCGMSNGAVTVEVNDPTYFFPIHLQLTGKLDTLIMGSSQIRLEDLASGSYLITLTDSAGCSYQHEFVVLDTNNLKAEFFATPTSGTAPLSVDIINQSLNYDSLEWYLNANYLNGNLENYVFTDSGEFKLSLIAYSNDTTCVDTNYVFIEVTKPSDFSLKIPNVISANGDQINDQFLLTSNQRVDVVCLILNRWGETILNEELQLEPDVPISAFEGKKYLEGTYFYQINIIENQYSKHIDKRQFQGFFQVVR